MNRFVMAEPEKCIGCRTCEVACVQAHASTGENAAVLFSANNFSPRLKVVKGPKISAPVQCRQCNNAECVRVCPTRAIVYRQNSVQMIDARCIGCGICVVACPYGAMEIVTRPAPPALIGIPNVTSVTSHAQKCDLCIGRPDGPACIPVCPTKALRLVTPGAQTNVINIMRRASA